MIEAGIHFDMATAEYFTDPCPAPSLTQSMAKILLDRSPLHAWHAHPRLGAKARVVEEAYVSAQAIGNAAHKLFLGRGKEVVIIEANDFRTNAAKETRDAVTAEGRVPILAKHHGRAVAMVKAAKEHLAHMGLAEFSGESEVVIAWEENGVWMRSMIDKLSTSRTLVVDLKTSGMSCAPHGIGRMMEAAGWDIQAAMHERGLNVLDPDSAGRRRHLFIAQENDLPYALTIAEMSESVMTMGRKKLEMATTIWRHCIENNLWPGYPTDIIVPDYPGYAEAKWLDREQTEFAEPQPTRGYLGADHLMAG
jgi:PDDEXK-like domain of unknown function (DUF3799)